jgi:hypothetical protein
MLARAGTHALQLVQVPSLHVEWSLVSEADPALPALRSRLLQPFATYCLERAYVPVVDPIECACPRAVDPPSCHGSGRT